MASLEQHLNPLTGFFSYSREDDENFRNTLPEFRRTIRHELSGQLGRSLDNFNIWQDDGAISHSDSWRQATLLIKRSIFFIPIVTPTFVTIKNVMLNLKTF
jgi:hypothetical protein